MRDTFCQACKFFTEVVFDLASEKNLCLECSTVLDDEDDEKMTDAVEPNSEVSRPIGPSGEAVPPLAEEDRCMPFDLAGAFDAHARRLGVVQAVKDRAIQVYEMLDKKSLRGRARDPVVAACLYVACRQANEPRVLKDICLAMGIKKREVYKTKDFILKYLETETGLEMGTCYAGEYLKHFCSLARMSNSECLAAEQTLEKAEELHLRRCPTSVAAGVVYIISQLSSSKRKKTKEIALFTRVAESTIRHVYKDMYPHISNLVPNWFANEDKLKKLPSA